MSKYLSVFVALTTAAVLGAQQDGNATVEVKGPHICCKQCVRVAESVLSKVEGVSEAKASQNKVVTFIAKDDKAAKAGVQALIDGGFFGTATQGGKEIKISLTAPEKGKADAVTVKDVHVCCGACQTAIKGIFEGSKVTFEGPGPQKTVRIVGKDLDRIQVMETLHKTGFNGILEK